MMMRMNSDKHRRNALRTTYQTTTTLIRGLCELRLFRLFGLLLLWDLDAKISIALRSEK